MKVYCVTGYNRNKINYLFVFTGRKEDKKTIVEEIVLKFGIPGAHFQKQGEIIFMSTTPVFIEWDILRHDIIHLFFRNDFNLTGKEYFRNEI